ncbi:hypothetical protein TRAPUB_528 [Trametes pubescens]|uniref:Uncharacterized protein n=1 Tax=Trametes pubescens TaxID=154538 RepID=A0A1M2VLX5_TRAPU|nr:hypothetical protein TRAPUB_528 [Trametes pubescens]
MSEQSQYGLLLPPDSKRRKLEGEAPDASQAKGDRMKGSLDKAKANYLSGQLRLRLQYARLKVEHGWQKQSLSEVENLYFRHTHLTRPYPVISPGGRRNGRTLSSTAAAASSSAHHLASSTDAHNMDTLASQGSAHFISGTGAGLRPNASLASTSSSSSIDTPVNASVPSTPNLDGRTTTPHAPHLGLGHTVTRYPVSRSDSTATVIIESAPSLQHKPNHPHHATPSTSFSAHLVPQLPTASPFREPFDPMEPTEHIDSQLAALRSMMTTSAMPIPLPPPQAAPATAPASGAAPGTSTSPGPGAGLTYDSFWSSHASATSYRALLSSQAGYQGPAQDRPAQLQAYASAPAALAPGSAGTAVQSGSGAQGRS